MDTPRTRLPRVSAGCFQKYHGSHGSPRFRQALIHPYRFISQLGKTMKHKI